MMSNDITIIDSQFISDLSDKVKPSLDTNNIISVIDNFISLPGDTSIKPYVHIIGDDKTSNIQAILKENENGNLVTTKFPNYRTNWDKILKIMPDALLNTAGLVGGISSQNVFMAGVCAIRLVCNIKKYMKISVSNLLLSYQT